MNGDGEGDSLRVGLNKCLSLEVKKGGSLQRIQQLWYGRPLQRMWHYRVYGNYVNYYVVMITAIMLIKNLLKHFVYK